ncbi:MAG TPA: hypothetical protein VG944_08595 [Fimbriimonas sp.]|nr:hypothetical protein [Fimbriimonas sp.]
MESHDVAPILAMFIIVLPIVAAVFARHQQKMALILRQAPTEQNSAVEQLANEVRALRSLAVEQSLAIDRIETALQKRSSVESDEVLRQRIS